MIRISVDNTKCIAAGLCVGREPAIFDQDDENGLVFVHREEVLPGEYDGVIESERICPSGAIVVQKD